MVPGLLKNTAFAFIAPYFDQIVAIILAVMMIPEPIKMVSKSLRDLLLFAPGEAVVATARTSIEPICSNYGVDIVFLDLLQTGRKTWIGLTLQNNEEVWYVSELKALHQEIIPEIHAVG